MDPFNLRQLDIVRTVIEAGSVTEAARRLNVSQPAVSKAIRQLEERLGLTLFERVKRRLHPSADALTLFREVDRLFTHVEALGTRIRSMRRADAGRLSIAAIPILAGTLVAEGVAAFVAPRPAVRVSLAGHTARRVVEVVARHEAEIGFVHAPIDDPSVTGEVICESEVVCLLARDHPLAARDSLGPGDLAGERLILLGPQSPPSHLVREAFDACGVAPRIAAETNLSFAAVFMAQAGAGVAVIDPLLAAVGAYPDAVVRPFRPRIVVRAAWVHSVYRPPSRLAEAFLDALHGTVARRAAQAGTIRMR